MQPKPVIGQKNSGYRKKPREPLVPVILSLGYRFICITVYIHNSCINLEGTRVSNVVSGVLVSCKGQCG